MSQLSRSHSQREGTFCAKLGGELSKYENTVCSQVDHSQRVSPALQCIAVGGENGEVKLFLPHNLRKPLGKY